MTNAHNMVDMAGKKFGRLTVIERAPVLSQERKAFWVCQCECGERKVIQGESLRRGKTKSCGCYNLQKLSERATHGATGTPEFKAWQAMRIRCYTPSATGWHNYGGRGITVCRRWRDSFPNFLADMGKKPSAQHSLERINNNKGYYPKNCRWATMLEQAQNKLTTRKIRVNGRLVRVQDVAKAIGMKPKTLLSRIDRGWPVKKAITIPVALVPLPQQSETPTPPTGGG